ncbi:MAG TPA: DMT family transporter [Cycloclasticus sp.]|jgi:transporter family-2 protein|nr:DMT family transporter [Cycloclasticus sp.]HIL92806.1 DMT family transporter [Cycloclasticus sp.]
MQNVNQIFLYALIMLIAGIGIPIMGALSGGLGTRLQSPALAAVVLFVVGFILSLAFIFFVEGVPKSLPKTPIPIQYYFGGLFILFYTLSITWVGPKFGIGNAVSFVLLGQLISMSVIDHYGLMGALNYPVTLQRITGLICMAVGVFLVVKRF